MLVHGIEPSMRWRTFCAELHDTAAVLARIAAAGGPVAALHEAADRPLAGLPFAGASDVLLIVGPEGGLDDGELARLVAAGAQPVRLGPTVLRTSTAAAVALGALGVLTDRWSGRPPPDRSPQ